METVFSGKFSVNDEGSGQRSQKQSLSHSYNKAVKYHTLGKNQNRNITVRIFLSIYSNNNRILENKADETFLIFCEME